MEVIEKQFDKLKELRTSINLSLKEFESESDKYNELISNSFDTEIADMKKAVIKAYGSNLTFKPIKYGFQVTTRDVDYDKYGDVRFHDDQKGFGEVISSIKKSIEENCTMNQGVKIQNHRWGYRKGDDYHDGYVYQIECALTMKYMDTVYKAKRIPKLNIRKFQY